jgi:hypothetical protein
MRLLVLLLAAVIGALHVAGIAREARRERALLGALGRLVLSGVVLAACARGNQLTAAVAGWTAGWLANGAREYRRIS